MRIGVFTDSHYSSTNVDWAKRFNNQSLRKMKEAYEYFCDMKCDRVICLGDMTDFEDTREKEISNLNEIKALMDNYDIPTTIVMGNHDAFAFDTDEFFEIMGEDKRPVNIFTDVFNFLFLDTCYFKSGAHYKRGDSDWTDCFYPFEQKLEETLSKLKSDTYVFLHHNLDPSMPADHLPYNHARLREIIEKSGVVKKVIQGHYHIGHISDRNGVEYLTLPAMCASEFAYYIIEG